VADATSAHVHRDALGAPWSPLVADLAGVPEVRIRAGADRVGELATATAGFRDQFYGLAGAVVEAAAHDESAASPRLVTVGLIDVLACRWGERATRFAGARLHRPVVDLAKVPDDLQAWVQGQLRPKLLVATQTKVLEVAIDEDGTLVPSTPVIAVHAASDRLWHLAAALSAPPVSALAMRLALGTALVPTALKLSAKQVLGLPLPVVRIAWDEGAALARHLARYFAGATDPALRRKGLIAFGSAMCAAYDVDPADVLEWWLGRIG
jgi:hypothetical protein